MNASWWTEADQAELDCLVWELSRCYFDHRKRCEACRPEPCPTYLAWRGHLARCPGCRGDAPLSFPACPGKRAEFVAHGETCRRCNPCPALLAAIEVVGEWREARELVSRSESLRAERNLLEEARRGR